MVEKWRQFYYALETGYCNTGSICMNNITASLKLKINSEVCIIAFDNEHSEFEDLPNDTMQEELAYEVQKMEQTNQERLGCTRRHCSDRISLFHSHDQLQQYPNHRLHLQSSTSDEDSSSLSYPPSLSGTAELKRTQFSSTESNYDSNRPADNFDTYPALHKRHK